MIIIVLLKYFNTAFSKKFFKYNENNYRNKLKLVTYKLYIYIYIYDINTCTITDGDLTELTSHLRRTIANETPISIDARPTVNAEMHRTVNGYKTKSLIRC